VFEKSFFLFLQKKSVIRKDLGPLLETCCPFSKGRTTDGTTKGSVLTMAGQIRHQAINQFEDKKGLARAIIGIFCDCELITDDQGFDNKLSFRLPFYTLLEGTEFLNISPHFGIDQFLALYAMWM